MSPPTITLSFSLSCCRITSCDVFHLFTTAGSMNIFACRQKVSYWKICSCIALKIWWLIKKLPKKSLCSRISYNLIQISCYGFNNITCYIQQLRSVLHLPFQVWRKMLHWHTLLQKAGGSRLEYFPERVGYSSVGSTDNGGTAVPLIGMYQSFGFEHHMPAGTQDTPQTVP